MPKLRANREAGPYVLKREPFTGSSMYGETYATGSAPHLSVNSTWMSEFETAQYMAVRATVTYIVWSFYTPIAYYSPAIDGGWYKVGQGFSGFTGRHRSAALRLLPIHQVAMTGDRGDWTVTCTCWGERHFTVRADAERVLYPHR